MVYAQIFTVYTFELLFQIGTLMESAWTLNETCRFRVQTPEQYDISPTDDKHCQSERKVSFNCKYCCIAFSLFSTDY